MSRKFGDLLRELREKRGYSINKLAEKSGVSAAHISRLENEIRPAPSPRVIEKIAKILGNFENLMAAAGYLDATQQKQQADNPELSSLEEQIRAHLRMDPDLTEEDIKVIIEDMLDYLEYRKAKQRSQKG